jgi:hypothetical protein
VAGMWIIKLKKQLFKGTGACGLILKQEKQEKGWYVCKKKIWLS